MALKSMHGENGESSEILAGITFLLVLHVSCIIYIRLKVTL